MSEPAMKRWFDDLESWWCGHGYRGGDSVLGVGTRSAQIRKVEVHVTFGVGLGHECDVRTGKRYPLRRAAIDPKQKSTSDRYLGCSHFHSHA